MLANTTSAGQVRVPEDGAPVRGWLTGVRMAQVVTANRLRDGVVVFWAQDGRWAETIAEAECLEGADAAKAVLAAALRSEAENVVLDVYAVDVALKDGVPVPVRLREAIRAVGPTVHPEHGKPSAVRPT